MSQGGTGEDRGKENRLAVYVRNFPQLHLTEEKFKSLISNWRGVDTHNSTSFQNKVNTAWNGWALVYFKNFEDRTAFLNDENQHYVRDSAGHCHKLKVSKWFQKPDHPSRSSSTTRPLPLYKADLLVDRETSVEEFERNCNDFSIQSFKGVIHTYVVNREGLGHNGFIEVKLNSLGKTVSESVLFHSDSFWLCKLHRGCYSKAECAKKSGTDDYLPVRLKIGSEVVFTARKIPIGILESCRFQAKSVWQGDINQPNFISPPSNTKLDEYLDDYLKEIDNRSGQSTPSPILAENPKQAVPLRQKPLQGSLKQLNSGQDKHITKQIQKKLPPSNFAQAVAAPVTQVPEVVNHVEEGKVVLVSGPDQLEISVHGHGNFTLEKNHFDARIEDFQTVFKPGSKLLVALTQNKDQATEKSAKYFVVRAFPEQSSPLHTKDGNNVFNSAGGTTNGRESVNSHGESIHDINFEDLDKYYETYPEIKRYLQQELPLVLPRLASQSQAIESLAHDIVYTSEVSTESEVLHAFFKTYPIPGNIQKKFITDFCRFRKSLQADEEANGEMLAQENVPTEIEILASRFLTWVAKRSNPKNQADTLKQQMFKEFLSLKGPAVVWRNFVLDPNLENTFLRCSLGEEPLFSVLINWIRGKEVVWTQFQAWLEHDTGLFRTSTGNQPKREVSVEKEEAKLFAGLELSPLELEFVICKEKEQETHTFILRAIIFLRKLNITFKDIIDMHNRHLRETAKFRNYEFNQKVQILLQKTASQATLDETNTFIGNNKDLKVKEIITLSCKKIDRYIPQLATSICGYLFAKANIPLKNVSDVQPERRVSNSSLNGDNCVQEPRGYAKRTSFSYQGQARQNNTDFRNNASQGMDVSISMKEKLPDESFYSHKKGSINRNIISQKKEIFEQQNSPRVDTAFNDEIMKIKGVNDAALCEKVAETLSRKNLEVNDLKGLFGRCAEGGIMQWNLEVMKLQLNPPSDVSVMQISELLWAYFTTIQPVEDGPPVTSASTAYNNPEVRDLVSRSVRGELEDALEEGLEVLNDLENIWKEDDQEATKLFPLIAGAVWKSCGLDKDHFEKDIYIFEQKHSFDESCVNDLKGLLKSWSARLEKCCVFKLFTLNVYYLLQLTMTSFNPNVYEEIQNQRDENSIYTKTFMNFNVDQHLYSTEGEVIHAGEGELCVIATKECLVLAHQSLSYGRTMQSTDEHPREGNDVFRKGERVVVHSRPVINSEGDIACHIALLAWSVEDHSMTEPPLSGILLPFSQDYYKSIEQKSLDYIQRVPGNWARFVDADVADSDQAATAEMYREACVVYTLFMLKYLSRDALNEFMQNIPSILVNKIIEGKEVENMRSHHNFFIDEYGLEDALTNFLEAYPSLWFSNKFKKSSLLASPRPLSNGHPEVTEAAADAREDTGETESGLEKRMTELSRTVLSLGKALEESTNTIKTLEDRLKALEKVRSVACDSSTSNEVDLGGETGKPSGSAKKRFYVKISREEGGDVEEVPTNVAGLLPFITLRSVFGGATALKYRVGGNPRTWRSLVLEAEVFHPPEDGWGDRVYLASFPPGGNYGFPGSAMAAGQLGSGAQLGHLMNPPTVAGSLGPAAVGRNDAALSSLSQLLVRQPAASIWGASTAPILGGISPAGVDYQDSNNYSLHSQLN